MKTIVKIIDLVNEKIARFFSYLAVLLVLQLTYEVVCRYVFNKPNIWSFDASYFISSILIVFGLSYTWKKGGHVGVDLFSGYLSARVNAIIMAVFLLVFFFPTWGNIVREMLANAITSWGLKEKAMSGSMPPIYPFKTWMMIGIILFMVQGVSEFLKKLYFIITGKKMDEEEQGGVQW